MKNQYFGDTRDLFKYDLVLEILLKNSFTDTFTFIPMLTKNEPSRYGARTDYGKATAGFRRRELKNFLEECVEEGRRNIEELEGFFKQTRLTRRFSLRIYKKNEYFSHESRERYFSEIEDHLLSASVILVDPDIGLEVKSMKGREEKYVKYSEVKILSDRIDKNSVLAVFQFIPRVKRQKYFSEISRKLKTSVGRTRVCYISDNQIVFFILTKNMKIQKLVMDIINKYGKSYNLITGRI
jgi:hypothetical protein